MGKCSFKSRQTIRESHGVEPYQEWTVRSKTGEFENISNNKKDYAKIIQLSNPELDASTITEKVFSYKKTEKFASNATEIHADEIMRIENEEVVYSDYLIQAFFSMDESLGDPRIFNESVLEAVPLGTPASYRLRIQVTNDSEITLLTLKIKEATVNFFATKHKWECLRDGALAQRLPRFVPGRELLSQHRADILKVYSQVNN